MALPETWPWPEGCQGALSLTFDDGLPTQLRIAIPMMNDRGLRATFYLSPRGDDWQERLAPWPEVAAAGHEIGNHSLGHTCSRGFSQEIGARGLETMTLEDIEADVLEAERRLQLLAPVEGRRSFCYPCYQEHVGEGLARQSYVPVIAKHFVAGRGKGEVANSPLNCDLHYFWSWPVERMWGSQLVGLAEQCAAQHKWGVMTFHGIHEGHLPMGDVDFRELCDHLARHSDRIWIAPVREVAVRIGEWRKAILGDHHAGP